jgi:Mrp family chromosome partitioning ATPase
VIIDAPPLLSVGDAMQLSAEVEGVVVVTRPTLLRRGTLGELRRLLDRMRARRIGFVVTGSERDEPSLYHGYAYGGFRGGTELARLQSDRTRVEP